MIKWVANLAILFVMIVVHYLNVKEYSASQKTHARMIKIATMDKSAISTATVLILQENHASSKHVVQMLGAMKIP